jgi:hypothetical protein
MEGWGEEVVFIGKPVGKGVAQGHSLPVVATGLIPCISRRADFPLRATPSSLPREWKPRAFLGL